MINFKSFLLTEALQVTTKPGLEEYANSAREALQTYFNRYSGPELKFAAARYIYHLEKVNKGWYEYDTYSFSYSLIENNRGMPEIADKSHYYYDIDSNWHGRTGRKLYKTPKDAIKSIPEDTTFGYRGISWEEWQNISRTGIIKTLGHYNLQGQENITLWSPKPNTAEHYASGFAPVAFKASLHRPGVIIAVPRGLLQDHKQNSNIPAGELGHLGSLSANNITKAWMLTITMARPGKIDLYVHQNGKVEEGSRSDISLGYAIREFK